MAPRVVARGGCARPHARCRQLMIVVQYLAFLTLIGLLGYPLVASTLAPLRYEERLAVRCNQRGPKANLQLDLLRYLALLGCMVTAAYCARLSWLWAIVSLAVLAMIVLTLQGLITAMRSDEPMRSGPISDEELETELSIRKTTWPAQSLLLIVWFFAWQDLFK